MKAAFTEDVLIDACQKIFQDAERVDFHKATVAAVICMLAGKLGDISPNFDEQGFIRRALPGMSEEFYIQTTLINLDYRVA